MNEHPERIRVLHVDDDPALADMVGTFLERKNERFEVETATDASEGWERLSAEPFDCVVSDYDMPGQNGIEFLETVRETYPDLPFVLYTGKGSEEVASDAISAGVTDYLQKEGGTGQYDVLANRIENVVAQYRSQSALAASQKRLSLFIEQSPLGVLEYDEEFEIVGLNERGEEILGYSEAELRGETWEALVTDSSYENVDQVTDRLATAEGGFHSVDENVRKDGEVIVCEWHNRVVTDDDGEVVAVFSQFQDVTERKRREEDLQETTARLKALFDESPDMINSHDTEGTISDPNPRLCEVTGYDESELTGMKIWELDRRIEPEEARAVWSGMEQGDQERLDGVYECKDGSTVPVEVHIRRLGVGGADRFVVISRDVSGRKRREAALEETNAVLSTLVETFPIGVLVEDADRNVLAANERLFELFDMPESPADVVDSDCRTLAATVAEQFAEPDRFVERIQATVSEAESVRQEQLALADGRTFARSYEPIELPSGTGHLWTYRDVSDQQRRERRLRRQNERLNEFTSVVTHDLRSPLNVAEGHLDMARAECESDHLEAVEGAIHRSQRLIDDLLLLAREGTDVGSLDPVALGDLVEECWTHVDTADATLAVEFSGTVLADRGRVQQLVENLVRNAVEHGGPAVTVTVGELDDGFYVEDDGAGIPEDRREDVFEVGYTTADDGIGFGVTIVERVAQAHGWTVDLTESASGGARFEFTGVEFVDG